jgi:hypothetical protein
MKVWYCRSIVDARLRKMKIQEMPVYRNSQMDTYEGSRMYSSTCDVNIHEGSIAVSYRDEGRFVVYEGTQIAPGHFELGTAATGGRATLHQGPNSDVLEGWWLEGGYEGMWRIELGHASGQA